MCSMVKSFFLELKKLFSDLVSGYSESMGTFLGREKKFLEWAENNEFRIEKFEFASFFETTFSYWQTRRNSYCAKAILLDKANNRKGAYLMTATFHPVVVKFVPIETIRFKNPLIDNSISTLSD